MKVLVFATLTGGGHMSAARATAAAFTRAGHSAEVVDFLTLKHRQASEVISGAYARLVQRAPRTFGALYRAGQLVSTPRVKSVVYFANTLYSTELRECIRRAAPDILFTSHLFAAQALTHLKRAGMELPPTVGVMTDYTCAPFWEETELDAYITPHAELTAEFTRHGMPESKLLPLGIPVDVSAAAEPSPIPMSADRRRLLVIGGSMGAGNLPEVVEALRPLDAEIICVCGQNEALRSQLAARFDNDDRVRILGYVAPLAPLIARADAVLSKSGGLTSTEIMAINRPFIVINPIEGVETRNAAFFERKGAALWAHSPDEIRACARQLLSDSALRNSMLAAQRRDFPGTAADAAVRLAERIARGAAAR